MSAHVSEIIEDAELPEAIHVPDSTLVVVGSGLAGYGVARELHAMGSGRPTILLTRDNGVSYSKPMLSNALTLKQTPASLTQGTALEMAAKLGIDVKTHVQVQRIDRERRTVVTDAGEFGYGQLVLAVGADQISLPLKGSGAARVHQVNDLATYAAFRNELTEGARVVIIGAGLIGCEFANDLLASGHAVDLIDLAGFPLSRLVPEAIGRALWSQLETLGGRRHFGVSVDTVEIGNANALVCSLSNAETIEADVVLSAVGLRPRTGLARQAGLDVRQGIAVDRYLRTSDPHIFAVGDCAEVESKVMPYTQPLFEGVRALAHTLAGDERAVHYPPMPVRVKTAACPILVCPPEAGAAGAWAIEGHEQDLVARFRDGENSPLLGFALSGNALSRRGELLKEMADPTDGR